MTLRQAFNGWAMAPRNMVLAKNSRHAVEKVLMKLYADIDLEQITTLFVQIADDRMTLTNQRMTDSHALDEIKCIAKNSSEFIIKHYKAQKREKV